MGLSDELRNQKAESRRAVVVWETANPELFEQGHRICATCRTVAVTDNFIRDVRCQGGFRNSARAATGLLRSGLAANTLSVVPPGPKNGEKTTLRGPKRAKNDGNRPIEALFDNLTEGVAEVPAPSFAEALDTVINGVKDRQVEVAIRPLPVSRG